MTSKLETIEGEQPGKIVYTAEDALSDGDEVTQDPSGHTTKSMAHLGECTFLGKGKKLWDSLRTSKSHDL